MNGLKVGRIAGMEVRIHPWWLFIFVIVAGTVAAELNRLDTGPSAIEAWLVGIGSAIGFFATVIAHEVAHAVVARRAGEETGPIVISLFGQPATIDVRAAKPADEARIAAAGPIVSIVLGVVLIVVGYLVFQVGSTLRLVADGVMIVGILALGLGVVTLVPAYPLDGGRIVRGLVWLATGDDRRGARAAAVVGRIVGWGLVVVGLTILLAGQTLSGLMLGIVGWLLTSSARAVDRWIVLDALIEGIRVSDALDVSSRPLSPQLTLDTFAGDILDGTLPPAVPVVRGDELVGVVGIGQVRATKRADWPATRAEDVMVSPPEMPTLRPDDTLTAAVEQLRKTRLDGVPVVDGSALLGMLTRRSVGSLLQDRSDVTGGAR